MLCERSECSLCIFGELSWKADSGSVFGSKVSLLWLQIMVRRNCDGIQREQLLFPFLLALMFLKLCKSFSETWVKGIYFFWFGHCGLHFCLLKFSEKFNFLFPATNFSVYALLLVWIVLTTFDVDAGMLDLQLPQLRSCLGHPSLQFFFVMFFWHLEMCCCVNSMLLIFVVEKTLGWF